MAIGEVARSPMDNINSPAFDICVSCGIREAYGIGEATCAAMMVRSALEKDSPVFTKSQESDPGSLMARLGHAEELASRCYERHQSGDCDSQMLGGYL